MENTYTNENGLALTVTDASIEDCMGIMGGNPDNPTWEEYLQDFNEKYHPHFELLKKAIYELEWVGETADSIANDYSFVFSDGIKLSFSWRAWGDLMQAIVGKREGYMTYYM